MNHRINSRKLGKDGGPLFFAPFPGLFACVCVRECVCIPCNDFACLLVHSISSLTHTFV